jgi:hypothetical protein
LQEWQAAHERIFKAMNANHDGRLTLDQIRAFITGQTESNSISSPLARLGRGFQTEPLAVCCDRVAIGVTIRPARPRRGAAAPDAALLSCGLQLLVALRVETPLRRLGRATHDALDHHGRDARQYGLGHRGSQDVGDRT